MLEAIDNLPPVATVALVLVLVLVVTIWLVIVAWVLRHVPPAEHLDSECVLGGEPVQLGLNAWWSDYYQGLICEECVPAIVRQADRPGEDHWLRLWLREGAEGWHDARTRRLATLIEPPPDSERRSA